MTCYRFHSNFYRFLTWNRQECRYLTWPRLRDVWQLARGHTCTAWPRFMSSSSVFSAVAPCASAPHKIWKSLLVPKLLCHPGVTQAGLDVWFNHWRERSLPWRRMTGENKQALNNFLIGLSESTPVTVGQWERRDLPSAKVCCWGTFLVISRHPPGWVDGRFL